MMELKEVMKKYNIRPNKKMGQHFLDDEIAISKIIEAANLSKEDRVLEIGPGLGILTIPLCQRAKKVVAVEKDRRFISILKDLTSGFKNICILEDDVLKLDLDKIKEYLGDKYKVVANLPYYITSPIIMKLIQNRENLVSAVIMVQKEVAKRLVALPSTKDYGILTIAVSLYADVEYICDVLQDSFIPPPKVDSAVVKIIPKKVPRVKLDNEKLFFQVVEAAFGERRKTLRNSLKSRLDIVEKEQIDDILSRTKIDPTRRGETLSLEEFAHITREISKTFKAK